VDFGFNEEQLALQDLAKKIFRGLGATASVAEVEVESEGFHRVVWQALAKAELLGLAVPKELGGGGLGLVELCLLLEQAGDSVCPIPLVPTLVSAALPIAKFGTALQKQELLRPVLRGDSVLAAALVESAEPMSARPDGASWVLHGTSACVPALHLASRVLVPACMPGGALALFLVDPTASGVTTQRQVGTNEAPLGRLVLEGATLSPGALLGDATSGREILEWILERTWLAQCALELGITRRALILTAKYASERRQFGRPIGTFQAVAQRAADAYVDVETIRLTLFRAAWLLDEGREASREVAVARLIAAEAGHRVVSAAQHIHGGIGFDRDYPLYRYFLASKQNEFTLGSASFHLARLGKLLAEGRV
jgi:alkylation response protein AidB-like acyl-CoA dehydrogenase